MNRVETIGDATLYLGDCLEILPTLAGMADAIVITDPPYGDNTYDTDQIIDYWPIVSGCKTIAFFGYPERSVKFCVEKRIYPDEWVTWWPTNKFNAKQNKLPKETEVITIVGQTPGTWELKRARAKDRFCRERNSHNKRSNGLNIARLGDVWRDASPGLMFNSHLRQHPNEKPESLMTKLIILCSRSGDFIIDPFMGSGTTGVAALRLGRKFIGIEIEPKYFDIACKRIEQENRQLKMF